MQRLLVTLVVACLLLSGCSPLYVLRAGWEEAGILLRRENIQTLIEKENINPKLKQTLSQVLEARAYAKSLGLHPGGSFEQYSEIDRDVLVWVLSGAKKTKLESITWWFPVVGDVPYKGFFKKEDAMKAAKKLSDKGFDVFLRGSPAFSTLGWFDDPLLSTMLSYGEITLVETVIHEILHNSVWVKNHVAFNESLANFVGSIGAIEFFKRKEETQKAEEAHRAWEKQKSYAKRLFKLLERLNALYSQELPVEETLSRRKKLFSDAQKEQAPEKGRPSLNNAVVLAENVYLTKLELFEGFYKACNSSLPEFIQQIKALVEKSKKEGRDPFALLEEQAEREDTRVAKSEIARLCSTP